MVQRGISISAALAIFLSIGGGRLWGQATRPQSTSNTIKNVLMIVSDDLKASALGCYGNKVCRTPHIDQLARRSLLFERAYCQGTVCQPSRLSFMFSRYRGQGKVNLGQHLRSQGMYSARVGKIYHMRVPGDIIAGTDGKDFPSCWTEKFNSQGQEAHTPGDYACLNLNIFTTELEGRQSTRMPHRMFVSVSYEGDGRDQPDSKTASKVIELLRANRDRPFFMAAGFVRPHYPMVAPRQYFTPYPYEKMVLPRQVPDDVEDIPPIGRAGTQSSKNPIGKYPDNQKRMWSAYYAAVNFMDEQVGRILSELKRLELDKNTAVIFLSDHGYHLGEHGFWQKANLHDEVLRVPLLISAPGFSPGRTASLAELVDIFPTITNLLGLPTPDSVQGVSLVPILRRPTSSVKDSALSLNKGYCLRTVGWAYMRYNNGAEELYDMARDPGQFTNLAQRSTAATTLARLRAALKKRLKTAGLP